MLEPKMILLDEPAGGINPTLVNRMVEIIRDLNRQGIAFLVVEHNIPLVLDLCDPVAVLSRGRSSPRGRRRSCAPTRPCSRPTSARSGSPPSRFPTSSSTSPPSP